MPIFREKQNCRSQTNAVSPRQRQQQPITNAETMTIYLTFFHSILIAERKKNTRVRTYVNRKQLSSCSECCSLSIHSQGWINLWTFFAEIQSLFFITFLHFSQEPLFDRLFPKFWHININCDDPVYTTYYTISTTPALERSVPLFEQKRSPSDIA